MKNTKNLPVLPPPDRVMWQYGKQKDHYSQEQMIDYANASIKAIAEELDKYKELHDQLSALRGEAAIALMQANADLADARGFASALDDALNEALDFAGTVGGGSSWWGEIWRPIEARLDQYREAVNSRVATTNAGDKQK